MFWSRACHKYPCPETDHIDAVFNEIEERTIHLTEAENNLCTAIGKARNRASIEAGHKSQRVDKNRTDEAIHIIGARGECGTCRNLGLVYKPTINSFRRPDLPHNIEVRTRTKHWYELKIRPDDDDSRRMVMAICVGLYSPVLVVGWIYAAEGRRIGQVIDPHKAGRPMIVVPQDALWPMRELKNLITSERG